MHRPELAMRDPPLRLEERRHGAFELQGPDARPRGRPNGSYNFVRVEGDRPGQAPLFVSPRLAHAQLAQGRPVVYAGTMGFEQGRMRWWSNYSGTYQPIAAFRARAALPDERFVPWQKLQMGGLAQQRGMLQDSRPPAPPPGSPAKPNGKEASR